MHGHPTSTLANTLGFAATSSSLELVKVPELWFDDGNLILQAETSVFRIYRGLLCARSSVFRDMFEFPPPAEGNRTLDGCPLVFTYDSAQDMSYFLKALLDSEFFAPPPAPTTMPIVAGILRLSTKYDVHPLRLRAMHHLLSTYPTTLHGWKTRDATRTIPGVENTPFVVLNLAREFDMPWLVPSVAYCICSHDLGKTLEGAEWAPFAGGADSAETGAGAGIGAGTGTGTHGTAKPKTLVHLSWTDQNLCLKGRCNLLIKQNVLALGLAKGSPSASSSPNPNAVPIAIAAPAGQTTPGGTFIAGGAALGLNPNIGVPIHVLQNVNAPIPNPNAPPPPLLPLPNTIPTTHAAPCVTPTKCNSTRFRCAEILTRWGTAGLLDFFTEQNVAFAPGFCEGCLERFKEECERASAEMWEALPELFAVGSWEEVGRVRELSMR